MALRSVKHLSQAHCSRAPAPLPPRYPPVPKYPPIAFYSAVRLGDPEQLARVMDADPYFITQDNGAGAPVHFATTYKQLDMVRAKSPPRPTPPSKIRL